MIIIVIYESLHPDFEVVIELKSTHFVRKLSVIAPNKFNNIEFDRDKSSALLGSDTQVESR